MFPEEENNHAIYVVDSEGNHIVLNISPMEREHIVEKCRYLKFVNRVSEEVFQNEPVFLNVIIPDSKEKQVFKSNHSKLNL